jgi:hypothetical protein
LVALTLALAGASTACQPSTPVSPANTTTANYLPAPAAGEGVQLTIGPFDVPAGTEVQKNFFLKLPVDQDVAIKRIQIAYPIGSHHCNIFKCDTQTFPDHVEDSFDAVPYEIFDMFAAAQTGALDWTLPEGVVIKLKKQQQLIVQTHWVNAATQKTPGGKGEVKINFWFAKPEEAKMTMGMLFAINKNLDIQPHTSASFTKKIDLAKLGINKDVKIAAMTGHFHSRGKAFDVSRYDGDVKGESVYRSENWDEPPFKRYDTPLDLKAGQKLLYTSTFQNDSDMVIKFGPHVENQEHSNLFMYFYPGPDNGKSLYDVDGLP